MPARAYLMSFLSLQLASLQDRFGSRFPEPWLVWEPGAWNVPTASSNQTVTVARPHLPGKGDALCFEVALQPGKRVVVGRTPELDIVINDATFSREQLVLGCASPGVYTVAAVPKAQPTTLDGAPLSITDRPLRAGSTLVAGDVTLRFYDPASFRERLKRQPAR